MPKLFLFLRTENFSGRSTVNPFPRPPLVCPLTSTRTNSLPTSSCKAQLHLLRRPAGTLPLPRRCLGCCARTRGPTRGHCSLRAIVPASPGHCGSRGGRGTASGERQGRTRAASCLPRAKPPGLPGKQTQRAGLGAAGLLRPHARVPEHTRPHLAVRPPPLRPPLAAQSRPEGAPPSRLLGLCCAPGLFADAGARPSCTWAALARGASISAAKRTFPRAAAAWAPWAHPHHPPASPPANPSTPRFSDSPGEAALRRHGRAFAERELELGHTQSPVMSSGIPRREPRPATS